MKKFLLLMACLFFSLNTQAEALSKNPQAIVNKVISNLMTQNQIPGVAVELYIDGKPYAYYYGQANKDKKIPVDSNTIFEVGSLTKLLTSLLISQEVIAKKINPDESFATYLVDFNQTPHAAIRNVSIQQLSTYTAGLPLKLPTNIKSRNEMMHYLENWKPTATIGSEWQYSNIDYGLLGEVLETVSHKNINQLFRDNILSSLGMNPIGIIVPKGYLSAYAQGYDEKGSPTPHDTLGLIPSAGALKASAQDMQRFLAAAIGLSNVSQRIIKAIRIAQTPYVAVNNTQQGYAWEITRIDQKNISELWQQPDAKNLGPLPAKALEKAQQIFDGNALIEKTGATQGFRAYIGVIPNQKSGIVILTNKYISNGKIVNAGREILLNTSF